MKWTTWLDNRIRRMKCQMDNLLRNWFGESCEKIDNLKEQLDWANEVWSEEEITCMKQNLSLGLLNDPNLTGPSGLTNPFLCLVPENVRSILTRPLCNLPCLPSHGILFVKRFVSSVLFLPGQLPLDPVCDKLVIITTFNVSELLFRDDKRFQEFSLK